MTAASQAQYPDLERRSTSGVHECKVASWNHCKTTHTHTHTPLHKLQEGAKISFSPASQVQFLPSSLSSCGPEYFSLTAYSITPCLAFITVVISCIYIRSLFPQEITVSLRIRTFHLCIYFPLFLTLCFLLADAYKLAPSQSPFESCVHEPLLPWPSRCVRLSGL